MTASAGHVPFRARHEVEEGGSGFSSLNRRFCEPATLSAVPTPMLDQHHIDDYLRHLAEDRSLASSTVDAYREELNLLRDRCVVLEPVPLAAYVTRQANGIPLAATTRNRRLAILRGFCRYQVKRGVLATDPTVEIHRARVPRSSKAALGIPELQKLLASLDTDGPLVLPIRDRCILLLLFYTGLRVSELVNLDFDQVDIGAACLRRATRKGGGVTDVVLHPAALGALLAWFAVRPSRTENRAVFPTGNTRLGVRSVQKRLKELGERAGLGVPLHPHLLRHAHATALLSVGVSTELIRMSMNHRSLNTTALYLHGDVTLLRQAIERLPWLGRPGDRPHA